MPDLPGGLEDVDAYIARQEDASGMPEMIAAHFAAGPSGSQGGPLPPQPPFAEREGRDLVVPADIPDDAIEAAAKAYNQIGCPWKSLSEAQREYYRERGAAILAAALPALRRHIAAEDRPALDEALTLLADAVPDPDGAIHSTQWHQRMDALAARLVRGDDNAHPPALRRHDAAKLASWEATAAELRRQLAGTNALLATARAQRQAVLDLCDDPLPRHWHEEGLAVSVVAILAALGVPPA